MEETEKNVNCPRCNTVMTFQGIQNVWQGSTRTKAPVYLCPACGRKAWYEENDSKAKLMD